MPIDSTIYHNPILPRRYVITKLVDVKTYDVGEDRPVLDLSLRIAPIYPNIGGTYLHSVIYATRPSIWFYVNFIESFRIMPPHYRDAIGNFACIEVIPSEFRGRQYSAIKYIHQRDDIKLAVEVLEYRDAHGELEWPAEPAITVKAEEPKKRTRRTPPPSPIDLFADQQPS